jgi:hypothetical protein
MGRQNPVVPSSESADETILDPGAERDLVIAVE